jgi:hypothetical protein
MWILKNTAHLKKRHKPKNYIWFIHRMPLDLQQFFLNIYRIIITTFLFASFSL